MKKSSFLFGFGKSMHRFMPVECTKPCMLGGIYIEDVSGFSAPTDGDVFFEAICLAIESITSFRLYETQEQCIAKEGITDSEFYLRQALQYIKDLKILNIAISLEGKATWFTNEKKLAIQEKIASITSIPFYRVGITHTSADGLNECGLGAGLSATALLAVEQEI